MTVVDSLLKLFVHPPTHPPFLSFFSITLPRLSSVSLSTLRLTPHSQLLRPHDLTRSSLYPAQRPNAKPPLLGPRKAVAISIDPFHQSSQSPLDHVLNPYFAQAFVNPLGRLKTRAETGLTRRSQRKVGKMVRRARAMGLISKFSDRTAPGGYGSPLIARGT